MDFAAAAFRLNPKLKSGGRDRTRLVPADVVIPASLVHVLERQDVFRCPSRSANIVGKVRKGDTNAVIFGILGLGLALPAGLGRLDHELARMMPASRKGEKRQTAKVVDARAYSVLCSQTQSKKRADNGAVALVTGRRRSF